MFWGSLWTFGVILNFIFSDGFVIIWKKGDNFLAVADRIVDPSDPRLKLVKETNGNTLEISLAEEEDAGDYFCQVSTYNPIQIKHSVRKLKVHELILIEFSMWIYPIQIAERSNGLRITLDTLTFDIMEEITSQLDLIFYFFRHQLT